MGDINDFAAADEIIVEIKNDNPRKADENIGLRISIMSAEDGRLDEVRRKQADGNVKTFMQDPSASVAEITQQQNFELVAAAITGWEWYDGATFKGEALAFNKENVMRLLKEAKHKFVFNQLFKAFTDKSRFF